MTSIYDAELLLVDDNPDLLRLLCEQLSGAGYHHIRTAATCAAARAAFDAAPPHLMVLDINLPDGDGFSLFRALRARADVPALFLSARDADADRLFGLGLSAAFGGKATFRFDLSHRASPVGDNTLASLQAMYRF